MRTKVKLKKQQIKEDKFTNFILQSREWVSGNWQIVAIAAAVVVLLTAGTAYYFKMRAGKQMDAGNRLSKAMAEVRQKNFQVAILELKSLSDDFGGEIGATALFSLANAYYDSKNYDEAISAYRKYLDDYHIDDITTASAIAGIAVSLECKQEFLAPGDKFAEDVEKYPNSPSAADYYLGAIRNYVQGGDRQKADKMLTEMQEKFPQTDYLRTAIRLAMQLKTN